MQGLCDAARSLILFETLSYQVRPSPSLSAFKVALFSPHASGGPKCAILRILFRRFLVMCHSAVSVLLSTSVESRHCLVYNLDRPGLFECFHQLGRLGPLCRKYRPGLV